MDTEYIEQVWNIEINDKTYLSFLGLIAFISLNVQHDFWSAPKRFGFPSQMYRHKVKIMIPSAWVLQRPVPYAKRSLTWPTMPTEANVIVPKSSDDLVKNLFRSSTITYESRLWHVTNYHFVIEKISVTETFFNSSSMIKYESLLYSSSQKLVSIVWFIFVWSVQHNIFLSVWHDILLSNCMIIKIS